MTFYGCSKLVSLVYLGSYDPIEFGAEDVFNGCDQLRFICVPSSYANNSFCGANQLCKHESCESFFYNQCYENPVCKDGVISMEKRENATKWERKTNECFEFLCSFESGPIYWKQCNKTDEVCENNQCVTMGEVTFAVEIEVEGIILTDLNMTEIRCTISDLTNTEPERIRIRVDTNSNDEIVRIIVIVNDEKTAEDFREKITVAIEEHNQEGVARHFKSARVVVKDKKLSVSCGAIKRERTIIAVSVFVVLSITHYSF